MIVKHKVSGQEFEVSDDYFERNSDRLQVLEKVSESKPKRTAKKQTKVVTEDTEVEFRKAINKRISTLGNPHGATVHQLDSQLD